MPAGSSDMLLEAGSSDMLPELELGSECDWEEVFNEIQSKVASESVSCFVRRRSSRRRARFFDDDYLLGRVSVPEFG